MIRRLLTTETETPAPDPDLGAGAAGAAATTSGRGAGQELCADICQYTCRGRSRHSGRGRGHERWAHEQWNFEMRGETPMQRLDRNYGEILQEVRVAQTGVQLLLAFLLTLAFTPRFATLTDLQRAVYVTSLILGAASTALLIAPAPFHRVVFQQRLKAQLVRASGWLALSGLALLMLSLGSALLLILDVVLDGRWAVRITAGILGWFLLWWYLVPLWSRLRGRHRRASPPPPHEVHCRRQPGRHVRM